MLLLALMDQRACKELEEPRPLPHKQDQHRERWGQREGRWRGQGEEGQGYGAKSCVNATSWTHLRGGTWFREFRRHYSYRSTKTDKTCMTLSLSSYSSGRFSFSKNTKTLESTASQNKLLMSCFHGYLVSDCHRGSNLWPCICETLHMQGSVKVWEQQWWWR